MKFAQILFLGKMATRNLELGQYVPLKRLGQNILGAFCLRAFCPLGQDVP